MDSLEKRAFEMGFQHGLRKLAAEDGLGSKVLELAKKYAPATLGGAALGGAAGYGLSEYTDLLNKDEAIRNAIIGALLGGGAGAGVRSLIGDKSLFDIQSFIDNFEAIKNYKPTYGPLPLEDKTT